MPFQCLGLGDSLYQNGSGDLEVQLATDSGLEIVPGEGLSIISTGVEWWEELARTTLTVAGDSISCPSFSARKYLNVIFHVVPTGGTLAPNFTFNGDGAANYAFLYSLNFTASTNATTQSSIGVSSAGAAVNAAQYGNFTISNFTSTRKLLQGVSIDDNNAGVGSSCNHVHVTGKWANTSAQITQIVLTNAGAGDFAIGSQMIVLGHD